MSISNLLVPNNTIIKCNEMVASGSITADIIAGTFDWNTGIDIATIGGRIINTGSIVVIKEINMIAKHTDCKFFYSLNFLVQLNSNITTDNNFIWDIVITVGNNAPESIFPFEPIVYWAYQNEIKNINFNFTDSVRFGINQGDNVKFQIIINNDNNGIISLLPYHNFHIIEFNDYEN